jgi:hypothetical protein
VLLAHSVLLIDLIKVPALTVSSSVNLPQQLPLAQLVMNWELCQGLQAKAVRQLLGEGGHGGVPSGDGAAELCTCIHPHVSAAAHYIPVLLLLQLNNISIVHASVTMCVG